ncbi:hypothetical protein BZA70DRAFT_279584 [Myxozyma melibiosi]|uniref:ATP synthase subunit d, mitochondrial n=1 Tax=Myxozyma melibiosi TaxID=54550 RepID=A0ABR1F442_9ASCO
MSAVGRSAALKLDWAKVSSSLGLKGATVSSLQSFRKRNEDARRKVVELSSQPTTVDFAYYRSVLKNTKVVDEIEGAFKKFKPTTYDVTAQLKTIEKFEATALENAKTTETKVEAELADLIKTLDNIESARPFSELTVDDVLAAKPELETKVKEMVQKGRWDVPGYAEKFGSLAVM